MLTDLSIRALKAPEKGQREVADGADVKGLTLLVGRRGRVWYLVFRAPGTGRQARMRLGEYPGLGLAEARQRGRSCRALIDRGVDPREQERAERERAAAAALEREQGRFETTAAAFVAYCRKAGQRRWPESERQLRVYIPDGWRERDLASISRGEVLALLARIESERGPVMANRVIATLRRLWNWAAVVGRVSGVNPASNLKSAVRETSRDRVLSDAELAAVWRAAGELGEPFATYLRFLALTGQRRGETAAMRWRDVNLDAATWEIPAVANKMGRAHGVPLSPLAVQLLRALPAAGEYVFSGTAGARPLSGWSRAKRRLDARLADLPPWRVHDLRRTCASGMARLGVAPHVAEKVLGHEPAAISGVAAVYNRHDYGDEKRRALALWAGHVGALADGGERVVALAGRGRA